MPAHDTTLVPKDCKTSLQPQSRRDDIDRPCLVCRLTSMNSMGAAAANLPGGHVEGYADSFYSFFRQVYADVARGASSAGSTYATFEDGHYEMQFCDAVISSAKSGTWTKIENG